MTDFTLRPLTVPERKYTYAQSSQLQGQTGNIGYLRGDFGSSGDQFYTTWFDTRPQWKSDEFKRDLDDVINALRSEEYGLLQSRSQMVRYGRENKESEMQGAYTTEFGFRADTEKYAFVLRCNPTRGDYNFYCFCYVKEWLDKHIEEANRDIRFIDCHYKELFRIPDGESIIVTDRDGKTESYPCRYGDGANPVILKSEFIMSLCEQLIGGNNLGAVQKSIIDRCTASVYRTYQQNNYTGEVPTLQDFRAELLKQSEPEAQEIALAIELFTNGSLNTFAKKTNVNTDNRLICYDILDLGKQLMPIGMLVVLDSILNRITQNRAKGKNTFIFIDEIYLLFQHEYSANFLFTLWKRVRKYGAYATGITQNVDDLLQSHTARTMLANSEFIVMLNQASTDRLELAKLLNISDTQLSYITNVDAGHGLIKVGSSLVPFANKFPKNTKLYKLMTTKPGEGA